MFAKYCERLKEHLEIVMYHVQNNTGEYTQEQYDRKCQKIEEKKNKTLKCYNEYFYDKEWYNEVMLELNNRKEHNTEILKWYGLI